MTCQVIHWSVTSFTILHPLLKLSVPVGLSKSKTARCPAATITVLVMLPRGQ